MKLHLSEKTRNSLQSRGIDIVGDGSRSMDDVVAFRRPTYENLYPEIDDHDPNNHDRSGIVLYSCDGSGSITSTARIAMDGAYKLPSELELRPFIQNSYHDLCFAELGRFIVKGDPNGKMVRRYYASFFEIGLELNLNYVFLAPVETVRFHERLVGARVLSASTGKTYGSGKNFAAFLWFITESTTRFKNWSGLNGGSKNEE